MAKQVERSAQADDISHCIHGHDLPRTFCVNQVGTGGGCDKKYSEANRQIRTLSGSLSNEVKYRAATR
jgi:hypothetical protein